MPCHTTPITRATICTMKKAGASYEEIQKALTGHHDISKCTINWIFARYAEKENYYDVGYHPAPQEAQQL